jgi:hypothetical protein
MPDRESQVIAKSHKRAIKLSCEISMFTTPASDSTDLRELRELGQLREAWSLPTRRSLVTQHIFKHSDVIPRQCLRWYSAWEFKNSNIRSCLHVWVECGGDEADPG